MMKSLFLFLILTFFSGFDAFAGRICECHRRTEDAGSEIVDWVELRCPTVVDSWRILIANGNDPGYAMSRCEEKKRILTSSDLDCSNLEDDFESWTFID